MTQCPDLTFLQKPPFSLDSEALEWVKNTYTGLGRSAKVAQLFNLLWSSDSPLDGKQITDLQPGAVTRFFGPDGVKEHAAIGAAKAHSSVPLLLVSADLEGSRMSLPFGTEVPNPIAIAAIDDIATTRMLSEIMAAEALSVGVNWSFTPVIDINATFRSAIVATRGFGADPEQIARHALSQIDVFQEAGLAATVKHWPGEGYDDRDQHLVTTVNPLQRDAWEASFGKLYRSAIDAGVLSVMSAHIAVPAYAEECGAEGKELYRPASISPLLTQRLLREELGFNGLIVSDAVQMAGITSVIPSADIAVEVIRAGCDMVLFPSDMEADVAAIESALDAGTLTEARVTDAVLRVLGLKAHLGLHKISSPAQLGASADFAADSSITEAVAEALLRAPTLVKDTQDLLPLDPLKQRKLLVISGGIVEPLQGDDSPSLILPDLLEKEGFEVIMHEPGTPIEPTEVDLVLYLFAEETLLTRGRIFLDWAKLTGSYRLAMSRPWHEVPTAMISFGYPYYLYDAPRVPTYINAYSTANSMQKAVVELLMGRAKWNRHSPLDPFAGAPEARY